MTYKEAVAYLESFVNFEAQHDAQAMREIRLSRMQRLCEQLGNPQRRFRAVLVTGTNGKGSICAMLYSMLRKSSLRAGLYTSPHLEEVRERIRVEEWIDEASLAAIMTRLQPILESMTQEASLGAPTYFEILTALAFVYFQQCRVEIAVLEVGLGGRLDATNIVEPAVSIIGPIALDHTDILGDDVVRIAHEKAGIIKPGQMVLTAAQAPEVMAALTNICEERGVPLLSVGQEITVRIQQHDLHGLQISLAALRGIYEALEIPLVGRHQADNAALAVSALEALSSSGVPSLLVERGLAELEWPGRLEVVHESPVVILDGAHNAHAARALAQTLEELCAGRRIHLLIGMSSDKSVETFGEQIGRLTVGATCTQSQHPRALDPTTLAKRLAPFCPDVHVMSDPIDAYTYLLNAVSAEDVIVVTGSLFFVGEIRGALRHAHIRSKRVLAAA